MLEGNDMSMMRELERVRCCDLSLEEEDWDLRAADQSLKAG